MTARAPLEIRALGPDDWHTYRAIRLAALEEAPHAFGSTLARAQGFAEADWRGRLDDSNLTLLALVEDSPVGLAGGLRPGVYGDNSDAAYLVQMWVNPARRGQGVGAALVRGVIDWARDHAFPELRLWIVEGNTPAEALYARLGFSRTGARAPVGDADPRLEAEMLLSLGKP